MNRIIAAMLIAAALANSGCNRPEKFDQSYHENFFALKIARALELDAAASEQALVVTNLLLLTNYFRIEFLADYEQKFLRYGSDAGFTNSLLEKYIVLPKGIRSPAPDEGEIVLVSAVPLARKNGRTERVIISKYKGSFGGGWIREDQFQDALREARMSLSELPPGPSLPSMRYLYDPKGEIAASHQILKEELDKEVERHQRENPVPLTQHPYFPYACFAALIVIIGAISWWFHRCSK